MRVLIKVTKEVLERSKMCGLVEGKKFISGNCGIAVAIQDLFPDAIVGSGLHFLGLDDKPTDCLPIEAWIFIDEFDRSSPEQRVLMNPFSFEIEVPEYVISKIGLGEIYRVLSESKSLELVMPKETTI